MAGSSGCRRMQVSDFENRRDLSFRGPPGHSTRFGSTVMALIRTGGTPMQDDPLDPGVMHGEAWQRLCESLSDFKRAGAGGRCARLPASSGGGFSLPLSLSWLRGSSAAWPTMIPIIPVFGRMMDYTMPWGLDNPGLPLSLCPFARRG